MIPAPNCLPRKAGDPWGYVRQFNADVSELAHAYLISPRLAELTLHALSAARQLTQDEITYTNCKALAQAGAWQGVTL